MEGNASTSSNCPPDVECSAEILMNKTMVLKEDTIGQLYIQLEDKEGTHVIKHAYIKKSRPGIADDGYSEIVYFEIDNQTKRLNLQGKELKKHKLIVQKGCFCTDAGYELITDGQLNVKVSKSNYDVSVSYNSEKTLKLYNVDFSIKK